MVIPAVPTETGVAPEVEEPQALNLEELTQLDFLLEELEDQIAPLAL